VKCCDSPARYFCRTVATRQSRETQRPIESAGTDRGEVHGKFGEEQNAVMRWLISYVVGAFVTAAQHLRSNWLQHRRDLYGGKDAE